MIEPVNAPDVIELIRRQLAEPVSFEDLLSSSADAIVVINPHGLIVSVNRRAEIIFGYVREELFGTSVDLLVPARFRDHHAELRGQFLKEGRAIRRLGSGRQLYGVDKRGTEMPVDIALTLFYLSDEPLIIAAIRESNGDGGAT